MNSLVSIPAATLIAISQISCETYGFSKNSSPSVNGSIVMAPPAKADNSTDNQSPIAQTPSHNNKTSDSILQNIVENRSQFTLEREGGQNGKFE